MARKEKRGHWWDRFFKKKPSEPMYHGWADTLNGYPPIYGTDNGETVYTSDVVQQAIYSIVTELKKLDPVHVRYIGGDMISMHGNIQNVLDAPNPLMTTADFIEKIAWTLLLNYNAFIYPVWEGDTLTALYPLQPATVEFDTDYGGRGEVWVRFHFRSDYYVDLPYEDIIHVRHRFSVSEFMGGNEQGIPDFQPLEETLRLNSSLLKGLARALDMQTTITGLAKLKTVVGMEEKEKKVKEFEKLLQANKSGILALDNIEDYIPLSKQVQLLDSTTLEFIDRKILRTWGVSIPIVNADFTAEQYSAFYQKTLEPIVKSLGQAFTKGIFTKHASQGFSNRIVFYVKELAFMTMEQKQAVFSELKDIGGCYVNEYRGAFGMRPLPELKGVRMMSLNYINANDATKYQVGEQKEEQNEEQNGGTVNE